MSASHSIAGCRWERAWHALVLQRSRWDARMPRPIATLLLVLPHLQLLVVAMACLPTATVTLEPLHCFASWLVMQPCDAAHGVLSLAALLVLAVTAVLHPAATLCTWYRHLRQPEQLRHGPVGSPVVMDVVLHDRPQPDTVARVSWLVSRVAPLLLLPTLFHLHHVVTHASGLLGAAVAVVVATLYVVAMCFSMLSDQTFVPMSPFIGRVSSGLWPLASLLARIGLVMVTIAVHSGAAADASVAAASTAATTALPSLIVATFLFAALSLLWLSVVLFQPFYEDRCNALVSSVLAWVAFCAGVCLSLCVEPDLEEAAFFAVCAFVLPVLWGGWMAPATWASFMWYDLRNDVAPLTRTNFDALGLGLTFEASVDVASRQAYRAHTLVARSPEQRCSRVNRCRALLSWAVRLAPSSCHLRVACAALHLATFAPKAPTGDYDEANATAVALLLRASAAAPRVDQRAAVYQLNRYRLAMHERLAGPGAPSVVPDHRTAHTLHAVAASSVAAFWRTVLVSGDHMTALPALAAAAAAAKQRAAAAYHALLQRVPTSRALLASAAAYFRHVHMERGQARKLEALLRHQAGPTAPSSNKGKADADADAASSDGVVAARDADASCDADNEVDVGMRASLCQPPTLRELRYRRRLAAREAAPLAWGLTAKVALVLLALAVVFVGLGALAHQRHQAWDEAHTNLRLASRRAYLTHSIALSARAVQVMIAKHNSKQEDHWRGELRHSAQELHAVHKQLLARTGALTAHGSGAPVDPNHGQVLTLQHFYAGQAPLRAENVSLTLWEAGNALVRNAIDLSFHPSDDLEREGMGSGVPAFQWIVVNVPARVADAMEHAVHLHATAFAASCAKAQMALACAAVTMVALLWLLRSIVLTNTVTRVSEERRTALAVFAAIPKPVARQAVAALCADPVWPREPVHVDTAPSSAATTPSPATPPAAATTSTANALSSSWIPTVLTALMVLAAVAVLTVTALGMAQQARFVAAGNAVGGAYVRTAAARRVHQGCLELAARDTVLWGGASMPRLRSLVWQWIARLQRAHNQAKNALLANSAWLTPHDVMQPYDAPCLIRGACEGDGGSTMEQKNGTEAIDLYSVEHMVDKYVQEARLFSHEKTLSFQSPHYVSVGNMEFTHLTPTFIASVDALVQHVTQLAQHAQRWYTLVLGVGVAALGAIAVLCFTVPIASDARAAAAATLHMLQCIPWSVAHRVPGLVDYLDSGNMGVLCVRSGVQQLRVRHAGLLEDVPDAMLLLGDGAVIRASSAAVADVVGVASHDALIGVSLGQLTSQPESTLALIRHAAHSLTGAHQMVRIPVVGKRVDTGGLYALLLTLCGAGGGEEDVVCMLQRISGAEQPQLQPQQQSSHRRKRGSGRSGDGKGLQDVLVNMQEVTRDMMAALGRDMEPNTKESVQWTQAVYDTIQSVAAIMEDQQQSH